MKIKHIVSKCLRDYATKVDNDECGLDDSEILELASHLIHIKVNKSQAADFLGISTRTLDRRIESGKLPPGRKDYGNNSLYWFKDELIDLSNECDT